MQLAHHLLQYVEQLQVRDGHPQTLSKGLVVALGPCVQLKQKVPIVVEQLCNVLLFDVVCPHDGDLGRHGGHDISDIFPSWFATSPSCGISAFSSTAAIGITSFFSSITGGRMTSANVAGRAGMY